MTHITWGKGARVEKLVQPMDSIGWSRYMKGMVSSEIIEIQSDFVDFGRCSLSLEVWGKLHIDSGYTGTCRFTML